MQRGGKHRIPTTGRYATIDEITTMVAKNLPQARVATRPLVKSVLTNGDELAGKDGVESIAALLSATERGLEAFLVGRDGLDWFEVLRRISGRLWVQAGRGVEPSVRGVAELAVHRFANWAAQRDPGVPARAWTHTELREVTEFVALVELYSVAIVTRRMLGKGFRERVRVANPPMVFETIGDDELWRMVRLVDDRSERDPNWMSTVGMMSDPSWGVEKDERILVARLTPVSERSKDGVKGDLSDDPLTYWGFLETTESELTHLTPLEAGLRRLGFGLAELRLALDLASGLVQTFWKDPPRSLTHGGYAVTRWLGDDILVDAARSVGVLPDEARDFDESTLRSAFDFLDAGVAATGLDLPLAQRPLRRIGADILLFDALHVQIAGPILWDLELPPQDVTVRARTVEPFVHNEIGAFGEQPWTSGRTLRVDGADVTDVDASVLVGTALVVVDCYASPLNSDLDRGLHSRVASRLSNLRSKLTRWDQVWRDIAVEHPALVPRAADAILPVIVSSTAEWIDHDRDPSEWLVPSVPRFCTLEELRQVLASGQIDSHHHAIIRVNR